jgi:predicted O-methyltransferase YrrM
MLKKATLWIAVVAVLAGVLAGVLAAQETGGPAAREARGGGRSGPGMQPGQDMRGGMQTWLNDLEAAYKQNNREKMGQLIADMKQRSERMRGGMGGPGGGGPGGGGPGFGAPGGGDQSFFQSSPIGKNEAEKKILAVLDDMDRNQRGGMMNVQIEDGRLLRMVTEAVGAKHVVEIGTSNGYSGIWLSLALQKTGGKLTTHEINAERAALARENFKKAGVDGSVTLVEGDAHENVTKLKEPIDVVFIDADKEGYTDYLNKLLPLVRPGGVILAHNISPRMADPKYIEAITTNPDLESMLHGQMSVTLKKR